MLPAYSRIPLPPFDCMVISWVPAESNYPLKTSV